MIWIFLFFFILLHPVFSCITGKCEDDNGGCNDECTLTDAGVQCLCPNGGELKLDGQTCGMCLAISLSDRFHGQHPPMTILSTI